MILSSPTARTNFHTLGIPVVRSKESTVDKRLRAKYTAADLVLAETPAWQVRQMRHYGS